MDEKLIKEQFNGIRKLMDVRISQLQDIDKLHWWEMSLHDEYYKFLCEQYALIISLRTNVVYRYPTEQQQQMLTNGLITMNEFIEQLNINN